MKICEYSRNNQQSYDDAFFNQPRITLDFVGRALKTPTVYLHCVEETHMMQEPISRSLQLPHIPVSVFSQIDLFLVRIYLEFRSPQEPQ